MEKFKYVILGAGPSGLSFAHSLLSAGEHSFIVLEKEKEAGGLCRSTEVDGAPLDIGGGHFLDIRRREVLDFIFQFMPKEEWQLFDRIAKIRIHGHEIDHPFEANLWQLPVEEQAEYLVSLARCEFTKSHAVPDLYEEWVRWKFGAKISADYMLPYNRKLWRMDLNKLGTYWLYKLPDVSFRETLLSCLERQAYGNVPAHAQFLYPKHYGYGEVWRRMGQGLKNHLLCDTSVDLIDWESRTINGKLCGEYIINTIPWPVWRRAAELPLSISGAIDRLLHVSIDIDYQPGSLTGKSHWIYEPDEAIAYHRILCRQNFALGSTGYWTETNTASSQRSKSEHFRHTNDYAYPVNTLDKLSSLEKIRSWAQSGKIISLGRWGEWEHMNSDVAVLGGINCAKKLMTE